MPFSRCHSTFLVETDYTHTHTHAHTHAHTERGDTMQKVTEALDVQSSKSSTHSSNNVVIKRYRIYSLSLVATVWCSQEKPKWDSHVSGRNTDCSSSQVDGSLPRLHVNV